MSDEIEFEGGFFEDANDIADDPFGFGNDFHTVYVTEVGDAKVTAGKDKIGMMVKFAVDEPKYQGTMVANSLGNGNWYQLPVPKPLRSQIPWDPNGEKEQRALYNLKELFGALGFAADEMGSVNGKKMIGRRMLTKIKVSRDENGFFQFRLNAPKSIPAGSDAGMGEFTSSGTSNGGKSPEELLREELENN